jgi:pimeloyl-ACP methyl ester carboxylesterase
MENHFEQARHVASWGMHAITLRLLNDSEWGTNGRTVARLVRFLMSPPKDLESRIDPARIVLVGYSFGAISASMALALNAPAKGAVLLDPAAVRSAISTWLPLVKAPLMVIGADENFVQANLRDYYFQHLGGNVVEVSVKDATHEDAQSLEDVETARERQITFNSIITSAAFSLAGDDGLEYVWESLKSELGGGRLFGARKK